MDKPVKPEPKKPYSPPKVTVYGTVRELTLHQGQRRPERQSLRGADSTTEPTFRRVSAHREMVSLLSFWIIAVFQSLHPRTSLLKCSTNDAPEIQLHLGIFPELDLHSDVARGLTQIDIHQLLYRRGRGASVTRVGDPRRRYCCISHTAMAPSFGWIEKAPRSGPCGPGDHRWRTPFPIYWARCWDSYCGCGESFACTPAQWRLTIVAWHSWVPQGQENRRPLQPLHEQATASFPTTLSGLSSETGVLRSAGLSASLPLAGIRQHALRLPRRAPATRSRLGKAPARSRRKWHPFRGAHSSSKGDLHLGSAAPRH